MPDPIDIPIAEYARAAAAACVFELRCRLLADNARLGDRILSCGLENLIDRLATRFAGRLSVDELALLKSCQALRNRLLHLELARHAGKLVALGEHLDSGNVSILSLDSEDIPAFSEQLQAKGDLTVGNPQRVSDTSTLTGRVYGWLFESMGSGAFRQSESRFHDGMEVLDRLHDELNREDEAAG